ncbi:hypothetical protein Tcan_14833 [Toxocara canis]|uniref:Transmembrane protein n=1 Tax=Toxocara canis TaxID=6265 RepID=A0A0B2VKY7_TOXCA|nr:hypothetical protein Tcan_14833 [Toxocara canis]
MSTLSVPTVLKLLLHNMDKMLKLGTLTIASTETKDATRGSLLYDIIQAQLALWTLVFSILYSYAWQQHRKKFLLSLFFVVPTVFTVCCGISALLTVIVILGRIFSTPIVCTDLLRYCDDPTTGQTSYPRRYRSYSGNSCRSSLSMRSASIEDIQLPVPLCRRHSSNGSINSSVIIEPLLTRRVTHRDDLSDEQTDASLRSYSLPSRV